MTDPFKLSEKPNRDAVLLYLTYLNMGFLANNFKEGDRVNLGEAAAVLAKKQVEILYGPTPVLS